MYNEQSQLQTRATICRTGLQQKKRQMMERKGEEGQKKGKRKTYEPTLSGRVDERVNSQIRQDIQPP